MKTVHSLLVVDDNEGDIELCRIAFEQTGRYPYIYSARNGEEALDLFTDYEGSRSTHPGSFPPQLILLDINMPRMNGFKFLEAFKEMRSEIIAQGAEPIVIVMITSSSDPLDRKRAESLGITADFLLKPPTKAVALQLAERFGIDASTSPLSSGIVK